MNKQDLNAALNRIKPRDALVEDTIRKANELRCSQSKRRSAFTFEAFNFKLAGAVCAFAIVLGLGIFAGANGFFSEGKNPPIEEISLRHTEDVTDAQKESNLPTDTALIMIENAKEGSSSWAVIEGVISGSYPFSSNENKIRYLVQIDDVKLCGLADTSLSSDFENGVVAAFDTEAGDEKFNELLNLMSSPIYVRLEIDSTNEEAGWKIIDFAPQN